MREPGVHRRRDRVTIDMRGFGERLLTRAAAEGMTASALVRSTVIALLEDASAGPVQLPRPADSSIVKLTLRLPARHAAELTARARAADASQGAFVAGLLDGAPPPPDRRVLAAKLTQSTYRLAQLSLDVGAFVRLLGQGMSAADIEAHGVDLRLLKDDVRNHLQLASQVIAALRPARRLADSTAARRT